MLATLVATGGVNGITNPWGFLASSYGGPKLETAPILTDGAAASTIPVGVGAVGDDAVAVNKVPCAAPLVASSAASTTCIFPSTWPGTWPLDWYNLPKIGLNASSI